MKTRWIPTIAVAGLVSACSSPPEGVQTGVTPEVASEVPPIATSATPMDLTASKPVFVPAAFDPPRLVESAGFKIVPLGPDLTQIDYDAYMSSMEHLQKTFTRSDTWPRSDINNEAAVLDMETEQARFDRRESFAYAVLTPDGKRERGCVYVRPSSKTGYDAEVLMWVTKAEFDDGFDDALFQWVNGWVSETWPFQRVAYPGRKIEWEAWDSLPTSENVAADLLVNLQTAERFIDAFYSFDRGRLEPFLAQAPGSAAKILYYQGWAEGGNYKVLDRSTCVSTSGLVIDCAITVQDDPVVALKTGFNVTDTFSLTFNDAAITAVDTSSNDQPVYFKAREWVAATMPDVMSGPCKGLSDGSGTTPGDCARAMTEGYAAFAQSAEYPGTD